MQRPHRIVLPALLGPNGGAQVYLRVCGVTRHVIREVRRPVGLSPRVRSHLDAVAGVGDDFGSIPADAGAPASGAGRFAPGSVYPRGCGGTSTIPARTGWTPGLSPRMRGHRSGEFHADANAGSIPADAGAPATTSPSWTNTKVYPRGCGGTSAFCSPLPSGRGLSPRMRGHPNRDPAKYLWNGSIPADAGAPKCSPRKAQSPQVYPRGCGGT